jgi:hypothetical protein
MLVPDRVEARTNALQVAARGLGRLPEEWSSACIGATLDAMVLNDASEVAACAATAARYTGYDPVATALQLGRDMAVALRID